MKDVPAFSLDHFLSLSSSELVSYAELFVNRESESIPEEVYPPLVAVLTKLDGPHLVYALEICTRLRPGDFVYRAVEFLSHPDASVCCAACRAIEYLPKHEMPGDLGDRINATPVVDLFGPDLHSGNRRRIGTNEGLIRNLLEKLISDAGKTPTPFSPR
jgi:hypothetical protein